MYTILAAMLTLSCQSGELFEAEADILRNREVSFVRISAAEARTLRRNAKATRYGSFVVYAGEMVEEVHGDWREDVVLLVENDGEWWHLRGDLLRHFGIGRRFTPFDHPRLPRVSRIDDGLIAYQIDYDWMAQGSGHVDLTFLIDLRRKPFRTIVVRCANQGFTGVCGGPHHVLTPKRDLSCEWRKDVGDFRCQSRETRHLGWTSRTATRTFWLLRDETIFPSRFDMATYSSGRAFADAVARDRDVIKQRVLIDGIGFVDPLYELSRNEILFGAPSRDAQLAMRFFLLRRNPASWTEVRTQLLSDEQYTVPRPKNYPHVETTAGFTPEAPRIHFSAVELEPVVKSRRLVEVVATEEDARAIFWIMVDHGGSRVATGAIRVATTEAEHLECEQDIRPPSATWLGVPDDGLPGLIQALRSQLVSRPQASCWTTGTIDWKRDRGWVVDLREAPCTDPMRSPEAVTISADGELRVVAAKDP